MSASPTPSKTIVSSQSTNRVIMVRPVGFAYNPETAEDNAFMQAPDPSRPRPAREVAREEFDALLAELRGAGIEVLVVEDTALPPKPDAVFLNNWFSTHADGTLVTYPMYAPSRRIERDADVLTKLQSDFLVEREIPLDAAEAHGVFLEGTGALVLDRPHRIAYLVRSERGAENLAEVWAGLFSYTLMAFDAVDPQGKPIYHTNVVMAVGTRAAIFCPSACPQNDADRILASLKQSGLEVVTITWEQLCQFAGNAIELVDGLGRLRWVMSTSAYMALTPAQRTVLEHDAPILHSPIPTIERLGGGSVRCMIAENFLEPLALSGELSDVLNRLTERDQGLN